MDILKYPSGLNVPPPPDVPRAPVPSIIKVTIPRLMPAISREIQKTNSGFKRKSAGRVTI